MKKQNLQNMTTQIEKMNGTVLGFAPESTFLTHPDDCMYIVIATFERELTPTEYTVWMYNPAFDGLFNGHYSHDYETSINEFKRRINR